MSTPLSPADKTGIDFYYYSKRCHKQIEMANRAPSATVARLHQSLASEYADKAHRAMRNIIDPVDGVQRPRRPRRDGISA